MIVRFAQSLLLAFGLGAAVVVASPGPPLVPGEQLKYSVSWAIVPGAGEIVVSAQSAGPARLTVTTRTSTRKLARILLPFDASAESLYDSSSGRLISLHDESHTRSKRAEHTVLFDYAAHQAQYVKAGEPPRTLEMPEGAPNDLITALLETRLWSMRPGDTRDAVVLFDDDFYLLTIHALRYEDVTTRLGSFHTLVLEPRMEKTPPKGMFKKGSTVQVWISQDERRLPVKFEVEFNIGTGTATLVSYTPPDAERKQQANSAPAKP